MNYAELRVAWGLVLAFCREVESAWRAWSARKSEAHVHSIMTVGGECIEEIIDPPRMQAGR